MRSESKLSPREVAGIHKIGLLGYHAGPELHRSMMLPLFQLRRRIPSQTESLGKTNLLATSII